MGTLAQFILCSNWSTSMWQNHSPAWRKPTCLLLTTGWISRNMPWLISGKHLSLPTPSDGRAGNGPKASADSEGAKKCLRQEKKVPSPSPDPVNSAWAELRGRFPLIHTKAETQLPKIPLPPLLCHLTWVQLSLSLLLSVVSTATRKTPLLSQISQVLH